MGKIDEIERDAAEKATYFENRTEAQELADHKWAEKNGLSFSGPQHVRSYTAWPDRARSALL